MRKIKVGVVGVGHLGRYHTLNYARMPEVDLVGVVDLNSQRALSVASEAGCKAYETLDSLLKEVEAVSIAVPTDQHFQTGQKVLEYGIHCLVEKPISKTLEEADSLIALAENKGVVFQVGHVERFNPAMQAIADLNIEPKFIESHRLAPFNPRGTEVAVVLDLMIHDIDIVLSLVKSPVDKIDASGVAVVSDSIDIANARIRFKNNSVANLTASRISQKKMRKMRLFQKDAYITVNFLEKKSEIYRLDTEEESGITLGEIGVGEKKRKVIYKHPTPPHEEGLEKELKTFIQTIQGKHPAAVSGKEGRKALSVALRIMEEMKK